MVTIILNCSYNERCQVIVECSLETLVFVMWACLEGGVKHDSWFSSEEAIERVGESVQVGIHDIFVMLL